MPNGQVWGALSMIPGDVVFWTSELVSSTCIKANHEATRERGRPDKWNFFYCDKYQFKTDCLWVRLHCKCLFKTRILTRKQKAVVQLNWANAMHCANMHWKELFWCYMRLVWEFSKIISLYSKSFSPLVQIAVEMFRLCGVKTQRKWRVEASTHKHVSPLAF